MSAQCLLSGLGVGSSTAESARPEVCADPREHARLGQTVLFAPLRRTRWRAELRRLLPADRGRGGEREVVSASHDAGG